MKRIFLLVFPILLATAIFAVITLVMNINSGKGALQVTSVPKSKVYLDDKLIGETPLCKCELPQMIPAGDYTVRLVPNEENFSPFEQKITINKATLTAVDRTFGEGSTSQGSVISLSSLKDEKEPAQLLVISFPDKANIFLDANLQGNAPILLKGLTASDHELSITKEGYKDKIVRISTSLGYKLTALVFLGVNPLSSSASAELEVSVLEKTTIQKVVILNTPTGFLRVRESYSLSSSQIGEVYPGDALDLMEEEKDWFKIKLKDGKEGWVSALYARKQ